MSLWTSSRASSPPSSSSRSTGGPSSRRSSVIRRNPHAGCRVIRGAMSDKKAPEPPSSEITPETLYLRRREFIKNAGLFAGTAAVVGGAGYLLTMKRTRPMDAFVPDAGAPLPVAESKGPGPYDTDEARTPFEDVTTYNNFYEFGLDKNDPARNAHVLKTKPWTVVFDGEVNKPQTVDIDQLISWFPLEERVYRM